MQCGHDDGDDDGDDDDDDYDDDEDGMVCNVTRKVASASVPTFPPPASSQFTLGSCRTQLFFSSLEFLGDLAGTGVVLLLLLVLLLAA